MRTEIPEATLATDRGHRANAILRTCVHCGMCNATCPTYQVRGDELDGPRGRIYLIKGLLESGEANAVARTHLDRCLTCRACETTCPSGVRYGELAEIGREVLEEQRPSRSLLGLLLLGIVPRPDLLAPLVALARPFRGLLPRRLRRLLEPPPRQRDLPRHGRVLLMQGCVQRVVTPEVNAHLADLLEARGMAAFVSDAEECCGGLALHAGRTAAAHSLMQRNVGLAADDVDAIVSTATGCGVTLKDYGRVLGDDAAKGFADKVRDVAEVLAGFDFRKNRLEGGEAVTVAWHPPCTLQHGQRLTGLVEKILVATGYRLVPVADQHLCCGSAGSYSLLQPGMASELKERKADALTRHSPDVIATANIGCQTHLADAVGVPVVHWVELLR
ncbi:MAG: glycolate oxidase subunit GlcF [Gammaproteobacteria bacterium]|nr:glycolate oxidase subunit GlcF [Gammaproteobacteria bacterium]